ncbi:MAG TPA: efflux RND transporter periplasmic adaptor subunit [Gemmatimonadaceae bacterium]|nr:efflux RND transporter periplasmic adaptor subunit [Gemmatimonadaceae bacterium]
MRNSIQNLVPGSPAVRRIVLPIGVLLLGLLLLTLFTRSRSASGEGAQGGGGAPAGADAASMPPMPVDVDTARLSSVTDAVRATGRIEANQSVELRPDETGRVVRIHFREGQLVGAGAPLVKIDDAMLRAQRERALADRDLARQQLDRVRRLREENAATPADLERAEATARSAAAALNLIELQLQRTTVRAPFAGVIGQRFISIGDYVTSGSRLLSLQTVDPQRAVLEIPERHAGLLRPGQTVEFSVAAYPGQTFNAQVEFVDPVVQPSTRTILVKARAPNRDRRLSAGMFIEARLATSTRASAVVIPEDAVQPLRTANVVWAVVNGQASRRVVELGARSQGTVEVISGVNPGELVVVGGLERMGEGMPVAPRSRSVVGG